MERSGAQYVNVFRSVPAAASKAAAEHSGDDTAEPYRMSISETPLPTCVGGGWLLARERRAPAAELAIGPRPGLREQQPLKVSYLCTSSS